MAIKRLEVEGVRCLAPTSWNLDPGVNVVVGENGAGKTSLLEAISLVCTGKTLRTGSSRGGHRARAGAIACSGDLRRGARGG